MKPATVSQLRNFLILTISIGFGNISGQNLVLNPSFEDYVDSFPTPRYMDTNSLNQPSSLHWWVATHSTGWHYKEITGYSMNIWPITSRTGRGWVTGTYTLLPFRQEPRVFFQTKLSSPLEDSCTYQITFYIKPFQTDLPFYAFAKDIGAYLSKDRIVEYGSYQGLLQNQPQVVHDSFISDTVEFTRIRGTMVSEGGEQYLTIGFFTQDSLCKCQELDGTIVTGQCQFFYQMDDVSVKKVPAHPWYADLLPDERIISPGDTLVLNTGVSKTVWNTGFVGEEITVYNPGKYWYTIDDPCFSYSDTINIVSKELVFHIPNSFTPDGDGVNDNFEFWIYGVDKYIARIYDRWGKVMHEQQGGPGKFSWDGRVNEKEAMIGVYVLQILSAGKHGEQQSFHKITLLR